MFEIDRIMDMIRCEACQSDQERGVNIASEVKNLRVFIRPKGKCYHQNVWENCAKILCNRTDGELVLYITELLCWIKDLDAPGARRIFERLICCRSEVFDYFIAEYLKKSRFDFDWMQNLEKLRQARQEEQKNV